MFILFLPDVLKLFFFKGTIIESSVNTIKNPFIPLILCCIILNHLDEDVSITTHSEQQMAPLKKKKKKSSLLNVISELQFKDWSGEDAATCGKHNCKNWPSYLRTEREL